VKRRTFITLLGGAASGPLAVRAQQPTMPVIGLVSARPPEEVSGRTVSAFRKGLSDTGYFEGQNVTVEYYLFGGQYDRLPGLMADLVRRSVAVIATPGGNYAAQVAKAATATIPIVFGVSWRCSQPAMAFPRSMRPWATRAPPRGPAGL
jgi:putative ABC transport system substrate-binding protein